MSRITMAGRAAVPLGAFLLGVTVASAALAFTGAAQPAQPDSPVAGALTDADTGPAFDVAANAAAAVLTLSTDDLAARLAGGESLKEVADSREVGYGTVARAVNDAVRSAVDAATGAGSLTRHRADALRADIAAWIDQGGQPDNRWFGDPT